MTRTAWIYWLLLCSCSAFPVEERLHASAAFLDGARFDEAIETLDDAIAGAENESTVALARSMKVEALLGAGRLQSADELVERMRLLAPSAFATWKAATVVTLRRDGLEAARWPLRAAAARAASAGQLDWATDCARLFDALSALADGAFFTARELAVQVRHADLAPSAAWLLGRLDAIEQAGEQRARSARTAGMRAGLADLWLAARDDVDLQRAIVADAGRLGCTFDPSSIDESRDRARLVPDIRALTNGSVVARFASAVLPFRFRTL